MDGKRVMRIFSDVNGADFIGMDTVTIPTLKGGRANPMQGKVQKFMIGSNVMVFSNTRSNAYENMINRRLVAEGLSADFEVGKRAWGERIPFTPMVTYNGKLYLEVIFLKAGTVHYEYEGKVIPAAEVTGLQEKPEGTWQQGLSNKVIIRTFLTDSIIRLQVNKTTHD